MDQNMTATKKDWRDDIYKVFKDLDITMVSHVPDAGPVSYTHLRAHET